MQPRRTQVWLTGLSLLLLVGSSMAAEGPGKVRYGDGQADGKQRISGGGEMIEFTLPSGTAKVAGVRIHGSRYGTPEAPDEDFLIYFLNARRDRVVAAEMAKYALFERGEERWVTVTFARPIEVPETFWVALDFRAHQRKGVYVSYDNSTGGKHSRVGLPGLAATPTRFGVDWMIEILLADSDTGVTPKKAVEPARRLVPRSR